MSAIALYSHIEQQLTALRERTLQSLEDKVSLFTFPPAARIDYNSPLISNRLKVMVRKRV